MTIIAADNIFALGGIVFGLAWFGFWIDTKSIGKKTSGVIWVLCVAMALSNTDIIPLSSATYDFVGGSLVPLAIPLLLYKSDLRKIFRESGPVMLTFCIASAATVAGAIIGFYLMDLGEVGPKVAGVYSGAWIGGAVNFLAVSKAVGMTPDQFSVSISASSIVSILALMALIAIPAIGWIRRLIPSQIMNTAGAVEMPIQNGEKRSKVRKTHLTGAIALSFVICALSEYLAGLLSLTQYSILFITLLAIACANLFPRQLGKLEGDFDAGMLIMYLFFAVIGASTDATAFLASAINLFVFGLIILSVHLTIVLIVAKLLKIDLAEAIVGSGAALVGPTVTAAIALSRGWKDLVTPGIMCGIFGYAIGTFIGVAVTGFLG